MPATSAERFNGRRHNGSTLEREWVAKGVDTEALALSTTFAEAPTAIGAFRRAANQCTAEEVAANTWIIRVIYTLPDGASLIESGKSFQMSFDIAGVTQRITHSNKTTRFPYVASGPGSENNAPDFKGAINVSADGEIEGADIIIPTFSLQRTYEFDGSEVTTAFVTTLCDTVGAVNSEAWGGFAADEMLLTGVSGTARLSNPNDDVNDPLNRIWDITYRWEISRTKTGISIAGVSGVTKKGWEYLWVLWQNTVDTNAKWLAKKARGVYCEEVYPRVNFATNLGI